MMLSEDEEVVYECIETTEQASCVHMYTFNSTFRRIRANRQIVHGAFFSPRLRL